MKQSAGRQPIDWYWVPIERKVLAGLCRRSDLLGAAQAVGFLAVLALTGSVAWYSSAHWPWYATVALVFLHGTCWAFHSNAFHELSHGTVFETRFLNQFFLHLFSFLSWNNPALFWASHTEHHKFTLHDDGDLEVTVQAKPALGDFLKLAFVNVAGFSRTARTTLRHARGVIQGEWEEHLFPPSRAEARLRLSRWARVLLAGHLAIVLVALHFRLWMLPVLVTFAPFYGRALQWLCNESQHAGLPGNVTDFRLCSRTIHLNPLLQFLYWHMNFHTDHHIYAAVPCYRLARLHQVIRNDLPPSPRGLIATWYQIGETLRRQKVDPDYRYLADVPPRRSRRSAASVNSMS